MFWKYFSLIHLKFHVLQMCFFIPDSISYLHVQLRICSLLSTKFNTSTEAHLFIIILCFTITQILLSQIVLETCCYPYHRKVERKEHSSPSFIIYWPFCSVCPSLTKQAGAFCSIKSSLISSILQINSISSILMHINVSFWKNHKNVDL